MISTLLLLLAVGCSHPTEVRPNPWPVSTPGKPNTSTIGDVNILFVGNSLTYTNDIPAMVIELGKMDGRSIGTTTYAPGGFSLEDHWNLGQVQTELENNKFDFFVGQQGPSSLPESLVLLTRYAKLYASACEKQQTKFALYMVWPDITRAAYHDAVINNYTEAARQTDAILCPAGLAWKQAWNVNPNLPLYGPDQFHPSTTGSVLAALTIYAALFQKSNLDFVDYSKASWKNSVSEMHVEVLKRAALNAVNQ
jgi:hypothetical protein